MKYPEITLALFGAIALPISAFADSDNGMEEIVVTATRMPQALNQSIADTTVLNKQDIRNSAATDVVTLLRSIAGIEVAQTGGTGSTSSIFMRGTNSNQVLILLDGVRINSATTGSTAIEHIMLDNIDRIEIVRGNVSSLYGSEAMGGVIQLFTKRGGGTPALNASAGAGNYDTQRISAGFSGNVNNTSFNLNTSRVKTDGVSSMNPLIMTSANPNKNGYDNTTFDANIKQVINANHSLSASLFSTSGHTSYDNAFGVPTDVNNTIADIYKISVASDNQLSDMWHSQLRLAQGVDDNTTYTNGVQVSRFQTQNNQLTWQNNLQVSDNQKISLSFENLGQSVTSNTLYSQIKRNVNSILGGYVGNYNVHQIQINLRQDHFSDFGTATTGLLGYGLTLTDSLRAAASISNAFKAPTFNDMYWPLAFGYQGNPNLKPERSENKEIGLHYSAYGHRVDAIAFDNRISDLIAINPSFTTVININQARIYGQEISYSGKFGATYIKASATFQNPRNTTNDQLLPRRAQEFGSFSASHDFNALNLGAEVRFSGARQDTNQLTSETVTLPSYQLMNLTARYQIDKHFNLMGRVGNLFDRNYSEVYGYQTLGRTLFIGLNYQ